MALSRQAFGVGELDFRWRRGGRVVTVGGEVVGGLCVQRLDQFFGGRSVRGGGLAWAVVAPEMRGRGYSKLLARRLISELKSSGAVVSTIQPVGFAMWRHLGYEIGAARSTYEASIASIRPPDSSPQHLERLSADDVEAIAECYRRVALATNGLVDRSESWWSDAILPRDDTAFVYGLRRGGSVAAYLIYRQDPVPGAFEYHDLRCTELMWSDRAALNAVLGFISGHRSMARAVSWPGPTHDLLTYFLEQDRVRLTSRIYCLTRILDIRGALESRGYPEGARDQVDLAVSDEFFADNRVRIRLEVEQGRACVHNASDAAVELDIATLSAIYTGWMSPRDAVRMGRLRGTADKDLAALERMFGGPVPWVIEGV